MLTDTQLFQINEGLLYMNTTVTYGIVYLSEMFGKKLKEAKGKV